jgi:negative regulator of sigma-B (phosphoserine phosphatase)
MSAVGHGELDWSVATRAFPGETQSGDHYIVTRTSTGWLLAVADGLGHGPQAAAAGRIFTEVVERHIEEQPVTLIRLCHEALRATRGSAGTVVTIDRARSLLSWVGVGNVEGVIRHADPAAPTAEYITMRGGIVGYRLPDLQSALLRLQDGDTLALATDGINGDFVEALSARQRPDVLALHILDRYAKATDDALVLVARWRLPAPQQGGLSL